MSCAPQPHFGCTDKTCLHGNPILGSKKGHVLVPDVEDLFVCVFTRRRTDG